MSADPRINQLLEEALDGSRTPEDVCREAPELLPEVRRRWERLRQVEAQLETLFPASGSRSPAARARAFDPNARLPQIPNYEMNGVLGHGGMGVVYRARHLGLNRPVALKMLLAGEFAAPQELARFTREAQAVAGLRHPNIVQVFDVGDIDGRPYFTMELMDGGTLARKLGGVPQPAREAAAMTARLAQAIEAAHRGGVVHRDLKPANVLLGADGTPKVSDFGLARRLEGDPTLTLSGTHVGTPSYMAPEQALGLAKAFCPGVDIYALGALLYEMLTGRPPFRAETTAETQRQVVSEEPAPPSRLNARTPRDLETICLKCLQKEPHRRYATAGELAADLERFLRDEPIHARPVGALERVARWVRRNQAGAGLLAAVALLLVLAAGEWMRESALANERKIEKARLTARLESATQLEQQGRLAEARAILSRLGDGQFQDLRRRIDHALGELDLLDLLENIRLNRAVIVNGRYDQAANRLRADRAYAEAFRRAELGELNASAASTAARIRESPAAAALVAALDDWAVCAADERRRDWLLDAARRADPAADDWRRRVRDPAAWRDRTTLTQLVESAAAETQSVQLLAALADRWRAAGGDTIAFLTRVQSAHAADFWANFALGEALLNRGMAADAVRYYQAALAVRPASAVACNNLGIALARSGQLDEAMELFRRALHIDPTFAHAHGALGNCFKLLRRYDEAIAAHREAVRIDPRNAAAHSNLGTALEDAGRLKEAIQEYETAVRLEPAFAAALSNLGAALANAGRFDDAIRSSRAALALAPDDADTHSKLGHILMLAGRPDEALPELRAAVRLLPDSANFHGDLGIALAERGETDEALEQHRRQLSLNPDRTPGLVELRRVLIARGRERDVLALWREALDRRPPQYEAWDGYAELCLYLEDADEYGRACRELAARFAASAEPQVAVALAQTLLLAAPSSDEALRVAAELLDRADAGGAATSAPALKPERGLARGLLQLRRGQFAESLATLRPLQADPSSPVPRLIAARSLAGIGRPADARGLLAATAKRFGWARAQAGSKVGWEWHVLRRQAESLALPDLPAFLAGAHTPRDNDERLALTAVCHFEGLKGRVADLYADAFAADPALTADPRLPHRYNAACCAALAGCGRSADRLDTAKRAALRAEARRWLRAELEAWAAELNRDNERAAAPAAQRLGHAQQDGDLTGLRDAAAMENLPPAEREECRALWADLAALLARAEAATAGRS